MGEVIIDGSVFLMEVGEKASDSPPVGDISGSFFCNTYSEPTEDILKTVRLLKILSHLIQL